MLSHFKYRCCAKITSIMVVMTAGGLAACSSGPELMLEIAPLEAVTLTNAGFIAKDSDPRALAAVTKAMTEGRGIGLDNDSGDDWHVLAALAVRPVSVGTYTDDGAREGEWAETPRVRGARREPGLHVLTVVATRKDGSDRRVVRVSGRGPVDQVSDGLLAALSKMAVDALIDGRGAA